MDTYYRTIRRFKHDVDHQNTNIECGRFYQHLYDIEVWVWHETRGIPGLAGVRQMIHDERSTNDRCGECQSIEHYSRVDAALFQCWQLKEREKGRTLGLGECRFI